MAVYAIVAYDLAGCKDVLGLWMQESEGARHWMGVFDELRGRGVEVCIVKLSPTKSAL